MTKNWKNNFSIWSHWWGPMPWLYLAVPKNRFFSKKIFLNLLFLGLCLPFFFPLSPPGTNTVNPIWA